MFCVILPSWCVNLVKNCILSAVFIECPALEIKKCFFLLYIDLSFVSSTLVNSFQSFLVSVRLFRSWSSPRKDPARNFMPYLLKGIFVCSVLRHTGCWVYWEFYHYFQKKKGKKDRLQTLLIDNTWFIKLNVLSWCRFVCFNMRCPLVMFVMGGTP